MMVDECYACGVFVTLDELSLNFAKEAFDASRGTVAVWLQGFLGLWLAVFFVRMIVEGNAKWQDALWRLAGCLVAFLFLNSGTLWMDWVVFPVRDATVSVGVKIATVSGGAVGNNFEELIAQVEKEIFAVQELAEAAKQSASIFDAVSINIAALIILIPFMMAWALFIGFLLEAIFKFVAITAIAPFVVAAAVFPITRGFAKDSIRVFLSGATGILFMGAAMGFTISVMQEYVGGFVGDANEPAPDLSQFFFSPEYWQLFAVGFLSVLFHLAARQMATAVAGVADSQVVSQALLAGSAAGASVGGRAARAAGLKANAGLGAGASAVANRVTKGAWGGPSALQE